MEGNENTWREQFVEDYTLVTDNTHKAYEKVMGIVRESHSLVSLSDTLREEWEDYIEAVATREDLAGREVGALLIRQFLANPGSAPFDDIARHYLAKVSEGVSA